MEFIHRDARDGQDDGLSVFCRADPVYPAHPCEFFEPLTRRLVPPVLRLASRARFPAAVLGSGARERHRLLLHALAAGAVVIMAAGADADELAGGVGGGRRRRVDGSRAWSS